MKELKKLREIVEQFTAEFEKLDRRTRDDWCRLFYTVDSYKGLIDEAIEEVEENA